MILPGLLSAATSRLGMVAVALIAGFLYGHTVARNGEAARSLRAENAALRADLEISKGAVEVAEAEASILRTLREKQKEKLDAYAAELARRPDADACRLGGDDIKRLHDFR